MAKKWWWKKHKIIEDEYVVRNKQFFISKRFYDFIKNNYDVKYTDHDNNPLDYVISFKFNSSDLISIKYLNVQKVYFSKKRNMQYHLYTYKDDKLKYKAFMLLFDEFANSIYGRNEKIKKLIKND